MCVCFFSPKKDTRIYIFSFFCLLFLVPIEITSRRLKLEFFDVAQQQASKAMEIFRKARLERNERALGRCPAWLKNLSQCLFDVSWVILSVWNCMKEELWNTIYVSLPWFSCDIFMSPQQCFTGAFQAQRRKEEAETMKLCSQVLWKKHEYKAVNMGNPSMEGGSPRLFVDLGKATKRCYRRRVHGFKAYNAQFQTWADGKGLLPDSPKVFINHTCFSGP